MLRSRIIPCLLVHEGGLVKTVKFAEPKYVGDPINAVKIFNEKLADELMVLDIDASFNNAEPDYRLISKLAAECRMPLCYGGGIRSADQALKIIDMGVEKISISSAAIEDPELLSKISEAVGRQSVVAVVDIKKKTGFFSKGYDVYTLNGTNKIAINPVIMLQQLEAAGAGEIVVNFIDRDGTMQGYDVDYAYTLKKAVNIPITFLGGAGHVDHIHELIRTLGVVGAAAGSLFVFKGKYKAVLINYPSLEEKDYLCGKK